MVIFTIISLFLFTVLHLRPWRVARSLLQTSDYVIEFYNLRREALKYVPTGSAGTTIASNGQFIPLADSSAISISSNIYLDDSAI